MREGFYPALGTPSDAFGNFIKESFERHVKDQVSAGAAGLLALGSMGIEPCIKQSEYSKVAAAAVRASGGECPVLVGVMDNSVVRVKDRIESLRGLKIDGVVATTPYYFAATQEELKVFFTEIAKASPFPLYLYDLPGVTKVKINVDTAEYLMGVENIKGIKTGDITTARSLLRSEKKRADFSIMFSGLDVFDIAYKYGLNMNLDGMFCCTPSATGSMYESLKKGEYEAASQQLDSILALRNTFIEVGVLKGFSYSMNLLGYEGIFAADYQYGEDTAARDKVKVCMQRLGML